MSNIRELEEKILQLEEMLAPSELAFPIGWKLKPTEARVLACLVAAPGGTRTTTALRHAAWRWDKDASNETLRVVISRLKRKLPKRVGIENVHSVGYRLTPESLIMLRSISNKEITYVDHRGRTVASGKRRALRAS